MVGSVNHEEQHSRHQGNAQAGAEEDFQPQVALFKTAVVSDIKGKRQIGGPCRPPPCLPPWR